MNLARVGCSSICNATNNIACLSSENFFHNLHECASTVILWPVLVHSKGATIIMHVALVWPTQVIGAAHWNVYRYLAN